MGFLASSSPASFALSFGVGPGDRWSRADAFVFWAWAPSRWDASRSRAAQYLSFFFIFSPFPSLYAVVLVKVRDSGVLSKHYKIVENFGFRGGEKNKRGELTFQLTWHMRCRIAAL
jgi:hypothetical protein